VGGRAGEETKEGEAAIISTRCTHRLPKMAQPSARRWRTRTASSSRRGRSCRQQRRRLPPSRGACFVLRVKLRSSKVLRLRFRRAKGLFFSSLYYIM
jgi:hypothetical protein